MVSRPGTDAKLTTDVLVSDFARLIVTLAAMSMSLKSYLDNSVRTDTTTSTTVFIGWQAGRLQKSPS